MAATKIKNVSGGDLTEDAVTLTNNVLTDLSSLSLDTNQALRGKLFYWIEQDDCEIYDESDVLISETDNHSWQCEIEGESTVTINETRRLDIEALNIHLNPPPV